jgi:hypothetical protein
MGRVGSDAESELLSEEFEEVLAARVKCDCRSALSSSEISAALDDAVDGIVRSSALAARGVFSSGVIDRSDWNPSSLVRFGICLDWEADDRRLRLSDPVISRLFTAFSISLGGDNVVNFKPTMSM